MDDLKSRFLCALQPSAALALLLFIIRGADTLTLSPANFPQPSPTV